MAVFHACFIEISLLIRAQDMKRDGECMTTHYVKLILATLLESLSDDETTCMEY
jgi:hypothetical protein